MVSIIKRTNRYVIFTSVRIIHSDSRVLSYLIFTVVVYFLSLNTFIVIVMWLDKIIM